LKHPAVQTSDLIRIALLSACAIAVLAASIYAGVTPWQAAMTLIGAAACRVLVVLNDRAPHVPCDYIQTGEGAAGAFALVAVALFISDNPLIISLLVLTVMLVFQLYLRFAISPEVRESALSGVAVQAVAAICIARIAWGAAPELVGPAGAALTGYVASLPAGPLAPALAVPAIAAACVLARVLAPELVSYSEGPEFCCRPGRDYSITTACLIAVRCVLVTITLLFSGWLCGIGLSAGRLYRGSLPGVFNFLALLVFSQAMLLVSHYAGAFAAAACAYAFSYGLFFLYLNMRNVRYDRRETL
jgi:hypothetical protein